VMANPRPEELGAEDTHGLLFLGYTDDPEGDSALYPEFEATVAFPVEEMVQTDRDPAPPGITIVHY